MEGVWSVGRRRRERNAKEAKEEGGDKQKRQACPRIDKAHASQGVGGVVDGHGGVKKGCLAGRCAGGPVAAAVTRPVLQMS